MRHSAILLFLAAALVLSPSAFAQKKKAAKAQPQPAYVFTKVVENPATSVKNQAQTGTCWCFATISFLESELLRSGKGEYDLSEMFVVRHNYYERMQDNYLRCGKGNISQGSIAHMVTNVMDKYGLMPESAYSGINYDSPGHNHSELNAYIRGISEATLAMKRPRSTEYYKLQDALFDIYLGELPEKFNYNGVSYTAESFRDYLGLKKEDYVELTSFTHHPFYELVPVEVPDNWDNAVMYNLPLDELMSVIDYALNTGYTVCWDGDVSEQGYVFGKQISIIPADPTLSRDMIMSTDTIIAEAPVSQDLRQLWFESFATTDDHLEHITGISTDQKGAKYYRTKNSWGTGRNDDGYHYMSESFVRGKTVSILVNKASIPLEIRSKLGIR